MKHWFTTAVVGEKEDGTKYTICIQKFFVDDERILADLSAVFANCGIGLAGTPLRAYIARNSMIALDVINAMVISLSANGGYDAIANTVQKARMDS